MFLSYTVDQQDTQESSCTKHISLSECYYLWWPTSLFNLLHSSLLEKTNLLPTYHVTLGFMLSQGHSMVGSRVAKIIYLFLFVLHPFFTVILLLWTSSTTMKTKKRTTAARVTPRRSYDSPMAAVTTPMRRRSILWRSLRRSLSFTTPSHPETATRRSESPARRSSWKTTRTTTRSR